MRKPRSTNRVRNPVPGVERLEARRLLAPIAEIVALADGQVSSSNLASYPAAILDANGVAYFTASDGINGNELWGINAAGTAVMVEDAVPGGGIAPGSGSSYPKYLTNVNGTVYFRIDDLAGNRLWRVSGDGIAQVVPDGLPASGSHPTSPQSLTNVNGTLYFVANQGTTGVELWRVNAQGQAEIVEDAVAGGGINPGSASSNPSKLINVAGTLYFTASDGFAPKLWRISQSGLAEMVEDADPAPGVSFNFDTLIDADGVLYFSSVEITHPFNVWRIGSSGLVEGVPMSNFVNVSSSPPQLLTSVGGTVYFRRQDGLRGLELWRVDEDGIARMVEDSVPGGGISPGAGSSSPGSLTDVHGQLYFTAFTSNGLELWRINATGLAEMVEDSIPGDGIGPGSSSSNPWGLTVADGTLFFNANDGVHGSQLWRINAAGQAEIVDDNLPGVGINNGGVSRLLSVGNSIYFFGNGLPPYRPLMRVGTEGISTAVPLPAWVGDLRLAVNPLLTSVGGVLYFVADDGTNGYELWRIDEAGAAEMVEDAVAGGGLNPVPAGPTPRNLVNVNGTVYFTANDGTNGRELWKLGSDGAVRMIEDAVPGGGIGSGSRSSYPTNLTSAGGTLFFSAFDGVNGFELWRLNAAGVAELVEDSTPGGGLAPGPIDSTPSNLLDVNGTLYFTASDGVNGSELWRVTGSGIAELVEDSIAGGGLRAGSGGSAPFNLASLNGQLFFSADDGVNGTELWRVSAAGVAELVEDSVPGGGLVAGSEGSFPLHLTVVNGAVYFTANFERLWRIDNDGVARDLSITKARALHNVNGTLYYSVQNGSTFDLWRLKADDVPEFVKAGVRSGGEASLTSVGDSIFFRGRDNTNGEELWRLDSSGPPQLVEDSVPGGGIGAGSFSSYPSNLTSVNGTLYLTASNTLYRVNEAGIAEKVLESATGSGLSTSYFDMLTVAGGTLYFSAFSSVNGQELWFVNAGGTAEIVEDAAPGAGLNPGFGSSSPRYLTNVDGRLYFSAYGNAAVGSQLWVVSANHSPTAIHLSASALAEGVPANSLVALLSTEDADAGERFSYTLVDGEGSDENDSFQVVGNQLTIISEPNFETKRSYTIRIRSTDHIGAFVEQSFIIAVTDVNEEPTGILLTNTAVAENANGALIGSVSTSDPDVDDTFSYTVDDPRFEIVNSQLKLKNGEALNAEAAPTINLTVTATDSGLLTKAQPFTITVNNVNEAPLSVELSATGVAENAIEQGIGNVTGVDPDAGDGLTFTVDDPRFEVIAGQLKLKALQSLNFESGQSVPIIITAHDVIGLTKQQSFTITVTDVNERPTNVTLDNLSVNENAVAEAVGAISVSDEDANETQTLSVSDTRFEVVGSQLKLKAGESLNHELTPSIALSITTVDRGGLSLTKDFTIVVNDVNEVPSAISLSADTVPENAPAYTLVGSFAGVDPDNEDILTFTVDDERFSVFDGQLFTTRPLDAETTPIIHLDVTATDAAGLSTTQPFTITVNNVNEAPSAINAAFNPVPENVGGALVGNLAVTDPDADAVFTFSVADARFEVIDGQLKLKEGQALNYEDGATVSISVTARDAGNLALTQSITLAVSDAPEAPTDIRLSRSKAFNGIAGAWIAEVRVIDDDTSNAHTFEASDPRFEVRQGQLYLKTGQSLSDVAGTIVRLNLEVRDAAANATLSESFDLEVENGPTDWLFGNQWRPNRYDVNADGAVTPLDALLVINQLNARGPTALDRIPGGNGGPRFFDTSGDDAITALDALDVIIYLNSGAKGEGPSSALFEDATDVSFTSERLASGSLEPYAFFWWNADGEDDERSEWTSR
jgi:ELWxxDGT repeat protein